MKAIETVYNGYRFRSRLEARWTVFFDALGVKEEDYEYEPEGFVLDDGTRYLPDFRIKCYGTRGYAGKEYTGQIELDPFDLYIEVKGKMTEADAAKILSFAGLTKYAEQFGDPDNPYEGKNAFGKPLLVVGNIPNVQGRYDCVDPEVMGSYKMMDGCRVYPFNYETVDGDHFAAYPAATRDGRFYLMGDDSSYINSEDLERTMLAYQRARQARFEFGE